MSNFAVIAGPAAADTNLGQIEEAINPLGLMAVRSSRQDDLLLCVGQHERAPCRKVAFEALQEQNTLLAGDIINNDAVNWPEILQSLRSGSQSPHSLNCLRGSFAIAAADPELRRLWVVTDPFAWFPVMIASTGDGVIVSTSLAAMIRAMPGPAQVNEDWIFEKFFFNKGVGPSTPVTGIERLPPGTITEIHLDSGHITQRTYRKRPVRHNGLVNGSIAAEEAISVFRDTVPRYFSEESTATLGLSEGLDCRTVLAALPEQAIRGLHSFTFGMSSSSEISEAADIARKLGLAHQSVLLDQDFLDELPQLAMDTVFLSDGLQNINRSHLLFTYRQLRQDGEPIPIIMTGVSGDHIFRDHIQGWGNVPHIMSADLAAQHRNGRSAVERTKYSQVFGENYDRFENRIEQSLDDVEHEYGEFGDPETYLSYLMFEAGPRYFGGQAAIANTFSTFRTPYWDPAIVELGYRLQDATLGFSTNLAKKDVYRETHIQTSIISAHRTVSQLPYKNLPVQVYAKGNRAYFQAHRLVRKLRSIVTRDEFIYSEDWQKWYRTIMKNEVQRMLGEDSRMRNYVTSEFIEKAIADADVHWIGKLMTAEYTLRLVENGWRRAID